VSLSGVLLLGVLLSGVSLVQAAAAVAILVALGMLTVATATIESEP
jgi:hypothetical protein